MIDCQDIENCFTKYSDTKKVLKDKKGGKSQLTIDNSSGFKFEIIDFEDCLYMGRETETKCDFGIRTNESIVYVELKGSDVKKGISQLTSTIHETKKCFEDLNIKARMIVTKFPKPNLVKQRREYIELFKLVKKDLIIKESYTEQI